MGKIITLDGKVVSNIDFCKESYSNVDFKHGQGKVMKNWCAYFYTRHFRAKTIIRDIKLNLCCKLVS